MYFKISEETKCDNSGKSLTLKSIEINDCTDKELNEIRMVVEKIHASYCEKKQETDIIDSMKTASKKACINCKSGSECNGETCKCFMCSHIFTCKDETECVFCDHGEIKRFCKKCNVHFENGSPESHTQSEVYMYEWIKNGAKSQLDNFLIEMEHLSVSVLNERNNNKLFSTDAIDNLADVIIRIEQLETVLRHIISPDGHSLWQQVEKSKTDKLARLNERICNHNGGM